MLEALPEYSIMSCRGGNLNPTNCPIGYEPLEVRDVAPCMECGARPNEIEHCLRGVHTYAELRIFGGLSLVLCNSCMVDFGSQDPRDFGLPSRARIGFDEMQVARSIDARITKDKFCPKCERRLALLEFLASARDLHARKS
jgi:hypothetical protein